MSEVAQGSDSAFQRPARALLGWLPEDRAKPLLAGGRMDVDPSADALARAQHARETVAARQLGLDQEGVVESPNPELATHLAAVMATDLGVALAAEGYQAKLVDLTRVRAAQPIVFTDDPGGRLSDVDPSDQVAVAEITLPLPKTMSLPVQFDEAQKAWIVTSPNPNLKIASVFSQPGGDGTLGLGFVIRVFASLMSVAAFEGKYVLRDGYHRAYWLLRNGVTTAPAIVRDFAGVEEIGLPLQGMLPQEAYLGNRPATLPDYLDDEVAADVIYPTSQKMIVIHGLEISPAAAG
jgi:hypothetical protein